MRIGIDLGGSHIGVGLIENGEILYKVEKDLQTDEKYEYTINESTTKTLNMNKDNDELKEDSEITN